MVGYLAHTQGKKQVCETWQLSYSSFPGLHFKFGRKVQNGETQSAEQVV